MENRKPFESALRNLSPQHWSRAAREGVWVDLDGTPVGEIFGPGRDGHESPYDGIADALASGGNPARDHWISQITGGDGPGAGSAARDHSLGGAIGSFLPGGSWSDQSGGGWLGEEDVRSQLKTGLGLESSGTGAPMTWSREQIVPVSQSESGHSKTGYIHYDKKGNEDASQWAPPAGFNPKGPDVQPGDLQGVFAVGHPGNPVAPTALEKAWAALKDLLKTPNPESDLGTGPGVFTNPIAQRRLREFERPYPASDSSNFGGQEPIDGGGSVDWELLRSGGVTDPSPYADGRYRGGTVPGVVYRSPRSDGGDFQP